MVQALSLRLDALLTLLLQNLKSHKQDTHEHSCWLIYLSIMSIRFYDTSPFIACERIDSWGSLTRLIRLAEKNPGSHCMITNNTRTPQLLCIAYPTCSRICIVLNSYLRIQRKCFVKANEQPGQVMLKIVPKTNKAASAERNTYCFRPKNLSSFEYGSLGIEQ